MKMPNVLQESGAKLAAAASEVQQLTVSQMDRAANACRRLSWLGLIPLLGIAGAAAAVEIDTLWTALFFVVALVIFLRRQHGIAEASEARQFNPGALVHLSTLATRGVRWLTLVALVSLVAVALRISSLHRAVIFGVCAGMATAVGLVLLHRRHGYPSITFKVIAGLTIGSIATSWFLVSSLHVLFILGGVARQTWHEAEHQSFQEVRRQREAHLGEWAARHRPAVALTLSGGGYRAAMTHAGVLWTLDQARIPIKALSTVSGGSIVGAAYAMGWPPEEFVTRLCSGTPGLPTMLLNFYPFMAHLLTPWSSGDTYWLHFYLTYFHHHTLADTGPPDLIVNATHYQEGRRKGFWKGKDASTRLAEVVAASGAFPAAFDPVRVQGQNYIDGGVVENLGVEGLAQYLEQMKQAPPALVIVSDMSAVPQPPRNWQKPSMIQAALHAMDVTYQSLHERIYQIYSEGQYGRRGLSPGERKLQAAYLVRAGSFWTWITTDAKANVILLRPTSEYESWRFEGDDASRLGRVAKIGTLEELSPGEIDDAVYIGAKITAAYLDKICDITGLTPCPRVDLGRVPRCRG